EALQLEQQQDEAIASLTPQAEVTAVPVQAPTHDLSPCILAALPETDTRPEVAYRQAGDKYILLEYGPNVLDLRLRLRVHALMEALKTNPLTGIIELSPGVRSLQINYDSRILHQRDLVETLLAIEHTLPSAESLRVP